MYINKETRSSRTETAIISVTDQYDSKDQPKQVKPINKPIGDMIKRAINPTKSTFILLGRAELNVGCIEEYINLANHLQENHGAEPATKCLKAMHNMVNHSLLNNNVSQLGPWDLKLDKCGFPALLRRRCPIAYNLLRSTHMVDQRTGLTILRLYELIKGEPEYDVSSIIGQNKGLINYQTTKLDHPRIKHRFRGVTYRDSFIEYLTTSRYGKYKQREYLRLKSLTFEEERKKANPFFFTNKAGPRGPALATLYKQALDIGPELEDILGGLAINIGISTWSASLHSVQDHPVKGDLDEGSAFYDIPRGLLGRLCVVPDKGYKHRLMAICNTWIQMVLRPYHIILLDTLSNLVSDSSHDQSSGCNRVKDATKQGKDVTSVDLTKATDLILADIIGDSFSVLDKELSNWIRVVRGMSFYNPSDNSPVSYITGNPMGLYTSFAGLAHFHNDIYQFSYHLVTGKDEIFESYQVLGDDSCCWNKDVATVYKYLLTILDIPISEGKSYYSTPNESVSVAEFAKRTFRNGQELTGISPSLSVSVFGFGIDCDLVNLPMLLIHLESTGHIMSQVHSSWIDKSIKLSLPKASRRRIKAISLFTQVQIFLYARRLQKNLNELESKGLIIPSPTFRSLGDYTSIIGCLISFQRERLQDNIGTDSAMLVTKIDRLIRKTSEKLEIKVSPYTLNHHFVVQVPKAIQRDFTILYEKCQMNMFDPIEPLVDDLEVESLRTLDIETIYKSTKKCKLRYTKRQRQLSSLFSLVLEYIEEEWD